LDNSGAVRIAFELRDSYVTNIEANARTPELARQWLGEKGANK
jgi:hypothetical protein